MGTVDLFDEDIEQLYDDLSAEPWQQLSVDDVRNSSQLPIRISYEYADMGLTPYGFNQNFTQMDIVEYFTVMKYISGRTIWDLEDDDSFALRRHRSLHKPLKEILDKVDTTIVKGDPLIFHFHLYTDKHHDASRETGVRSPRIYFMQGLYGVIYILFFDPFHEITQ